MMAIATHCNLKPPNLAPAVLNLINNYTLITRHIIMGVPSIEGSEQAHPPIRGS